MLEYHTGDERPSWRPTILLNAEADDFTSGHTFSVRISDENRATPDLVKTSGIVGFTNGAIEVKWDDDDLEIPPGIYVIQLTVKRDGDNAEFTIEDDLRIKPRIPSV